MGPILFTIGSLYIYTYGFFVVLSVIIGCLITSYLVRRKKMKLKFLYDNLLFVSLFGFIFARLAFLLTYNGTIDSIGQLFYFWQEGLSGYGGILGGSIFAYFFLKKQHENPWRWLDAMMIGLYGGWVVYNIGVILSRDPIVEESIALTNVWKFETIGIFLLTSVLYVLWRNRAYLEGYVFFIGLGLHSFMRFLFGFTDNTNYRYYYLTVEQMFALVILGASVVIVFAWHRLVKPNLVRRLLTHFTNV